MCYIHCNDKHTWAKNQIVIAAWPLLSISLFMDKLDDYALLIMPWELFYN